MNLSVSLHIGKMYSNLGTALQKQLDAINDGEPLEDQNPNALAVIRDEYLDALLSLYKDDDFDDDFFQEVTSLKEEINEYLNGRNAA